MSTCSEEPAPKHPRPADSSRIILFGDSITQFSFDPDMGGWGIHIANRYQRRADVLNRGFSGWVKIGW